MPKVSCRGKTAKGEACRAAAGASGLCFLHGNPARAKELGQIAEIESLTAVVARGLELRVLIQGRATVVNSLQHVAHRCEIGRQQRRQHTCPGDQDERIQRPRVGRRDPYLVDQPRVLPTRLQDRGHRDRRNARHCR